jgi:uncharacterized repeat protein (TIGR04076 family)
MPVCKITALKTMSDQGVAGENRQAGQMLCPYFTEGQEFIVDDHPGEDFCALAWNDIYKSYAALMSEGDYVEVRERNTIIARCRDTIRPVFFKLEKIGN